MFRQATGMIFYPLILVSANLETGTEKKDLKDTESTFMNQVHLASPAQEQEK